MEAGQKRLYRSSRDRVVAGVCGGLAEYFNIDPVLVRLAWVASVLLGGFGILLYIFCIFIVPMNPDRTGSRVAHSGSSWMGAVVGGGLIVLGALLLLDNFFWIDIDRWWHWSWEFFGPVLLIAFGVFIMTRRGHASAEPAASAVPGETTAEGATVEGPRRFRKSRNERKLFGVCGGLAEYFAVDPTLMRLLVAGVTLAAPAVGILGYIALAILAPPAEAERAQAAPGGV